MAECEVTIGENGEEEEEIITKKRNRKTSEMWNYFTALSSDHALCKLCNQRFSYRTSTSNLRKHIVCKHSSARHSESNLKFSDENKSPPTTQPKEIQVTPEKVLIKRENVKLRTESLKRPLFTEMNCRTDRSETCSPDQRKEPDEYDAIGIAVSSKLRKMDAMQRLYCEKIIHSALFKGALKQLTEQSEITISFQASTTHES